MTLEYESSRGKVAVWYWRSLRRNPKHLGAWILNILAIAGITFIFARTRAGTTPAQAFVAAVGAAVLWAAALALYPQFAFRPQRRTITVTSDGIATTIGNRSGTRSWADIATIEAGSDVICVVSKNMNAFLIPSRAFSRFEERETFLNQCQEWLAASRANTRTRGGSGERSSG